MNRHQPPVALNFDDVAPSDAKPRLPTLGPAASPPCCVNFTMLTWTLLNELRFRVEW